MKKKRLKQLVRLASQFLFVRHTFWVDVPWKSLKMKMTFVLTCVQPLRQVQTTQSLLIAISSDVSVKWMPSLMVRMSWFQVLWNTSSVQGFTQGTQWQFTHHKPFLRKSKRLSLTTLNAWLLVLTVSVWWTFSSLLRMKRSMLSRLTHVPAVPYHSCLRWLISQWLKLLQTWF